jgi:hypothetical protein
MRYFVAALINFTLCTIAAAFLTPSGDPLTYIVNVSVIFTVGGALYTLGLRNSARNRGKDKEQKRGSRKADITSRAEKGDITD